MSKIKTKDAIRFSSLVMSTILPIYGKSFKFSEITDEFRLIMNSKSGYTQSTLGDCVQVYIIQSLCTNIQIDLNYEINFTAHQINKNKSVNLTMKNYDIIYW